MTKRENIEYPDNDNLYLHNHRGVYCCLIVLFLLFISMVLTIGQMKCHIQRLQNDVSLYRDCFDSTIVEKIGTIEEAYIQNVVSEATHKTYDTYISTQGNLLGLIAALITVISIVIPLIINKMVQDNNEKWLNLGVKKKTAKMKQELEGKSKELSSQIQQQKELLDNYKKTLEEHVKNVDDIIRRQRVSIENQQISINRINDDVEKLKEDKRLEIQNADSIKLVENAKDDDERINILNEEISKNQGVYPSSQFLELGKLKLKKGEIGEAISNFKIAIDRKPEFGDAYHALSKAYMAKAENELKEELQERYLKDAWRAIEYALGIEEKSSYLETRCKVFIKMGLFMNANDDAEKMLVGAPMDEKEKYSTLLEEILQKRGNDTMDMEVKIITVNDVNIKMIRIHKGVFTMGAEKADKEALLDEKPAHRVLIDDYYIAETVVTQELWETVIGHNPSFFKGKSNPVEQISWYDAKEFIKILNKITGQSFRLPTEAEWEYAARGGNKSMGFRFSGSDVLDEVAWYWRNSGDFRYMSNEKFDWDIVQANNGRTHPVMQKKANELGLYDMSGNVLEWCEDYESSYAKDPRENPMCYSPSGFRVCRGGRWGGYERGCFVYARYYKDPDCHDNSIGLRLALDA